MKGIKRKRQNWRMKRKKWRKRVEGMKRPSLHSLMCLSLEISLQYSLKQKSWTRLQRILLLWYAFFLIFNLDFSFVAIVIRVKKFKPATLVLNAKMQCMHGVAYQLERMKRVVRRFVENVMVCIFLYFVNF